MSAGKRLHITGIFGCCSGFLLGFWLIFACTPPLRVETSADELSLYDLSCEYQTNPLGIDEPTPRLGWKIASGQRNTVQSAYHIQVASSSDALLTGMPDLWDSEKVYSRQSLNVPYAGQPLSSRQRCYWRVRIWNQRGEVSGWSEPAFWTMGLLSPQDWGAQWISWQYAPVSDKREAFESQPTPFDGSDTAATYLRREFPVKAGLKRATVTLSGLGYYELYANGRRVGDHVLDPVFTDYQRRVHYLTYDVTSLLQEGENALGVILGNGFYNLPTQDLFQMNRANWKTPNKLILNLHLEYEDGTSEQIVTDRQWKWSTGELVYNSIRGGETIDMPRAQPGWHTVNFTDTHWQPGVEVPAPVGPLRAQTMPPMRVTRTLPAQALFEPKPGIYVFDFGENLTGWAAMQIKGQAGMRLTFNFNEVLHSDSTLNTEHSSGHTWGRFQRGYFVSAGAQKEVYEPRFAYHGFRYVQVEGLPYCPALEDMVAKSVHTDLANAGSFSCSSERLNQLHSAVRRTLLNSIHGMPGEEPTREKMGWTFDAGMVTMESYLMNFEATRTYEKYLQDLIDAQEPNGHVPPIVPTNGWGFITKDTMVMFDDPWWGGTLVYVASTLYNYTGDSSVLARAYEPMKRYTNFVAGTAADDGLVYWSLGDWLDLKHGANGWGPGLTPIVQTSTAALYYMLSQLAKLAEVLNKADEARQFKQRANQLMQLYNQKFLQPNGWYAPNSQTAQALPLYLALVPEAKIELVTQHLLEAISENNYHTSVGFVGIHPLLAYLSANGELETVYRMVQQEESPGWLHFVKNDKSTLGENLNAAGYGTAHHPFAANIGFWLYQYVAGIQPGRGGAGWQVFTLRPGLETDLTAARAEYSSPYGRIRSEWQRQGSDITYTFEVPVNTTAQLIVPPGFRVVSSSAPALPENSNFLPASSAATDSLYFGSGAYTLQLSKTINH